MYRRLVFIESYSLGFYGANKDSIKTNTVFMLSLNQEMFFVKISRFMTHLGFMSLIKPFLFSILVKLIESSK